MSRGLFIFVVQMIAGVGVAAVGLWAVFRPKHLQQFVNHNFALLPEVREAGQIAPLCLRLIGIFALWHGCTLIVALRQELLSLGLH
jgi:hypothetical protein